MLLLSSASKSACSGLFGRISSLEEWLADALRFVGSMMVGLVDHSNGTLRKSVSQWKETRKQNQAREELHPKAMKLVYTKTAELGRDRLQTAGHGDKDSLPHVAHVMVSASLHFLLSTLQSTPNAHSMRFARTKSFLLNGAILQARVVTCSVGHIQPRRPLPRPSKMTSGGSCGSALQ